MSDSSKTDAPRGPLTPASLLVGSQKGVAICDEPQDILPKDQDETKEPTPVAQSPKLYRASISGKKMTGRPALNQSGSSLCLTPQWSNVKTDDDTINEASIAENFTTDAPSLLSQVTEWLHEERRKRNLSAHRQHQGNDHEGKPTLQNEGPASFSSSSQIKRDRDQDQDLALDRLEHILAGFASSSLSSITKLHHRPSSGIMRKGSVGKILKRQSVAGQVSDTDTNDAVAKIPAAEVYLDNSKTLAFTGGEADTDSPAANESKAQKNWDNFKEEIVRLTHTLKLSGWRQVPIEQGRTICVERLSGALTNAVYVVKPPEDLPDPPKKDPNSDRTPRKPLNLLLRIYGPQAEHLIDRDTELNILRRLAVKSIGPKLLGYFNNGRFEEFLHAKTLDAHDLRVPDTSKQIAKRMRELHSGIDLLESEKEQGPFVFVNWDKWVDRCEKVITWLDSQVHLERRGKSPASRRYTRRGFVCGVEWPVFRRAYEQYRKKLLEQSGGTLGVRKQLVFAHNDTQYGNLMRIEPPSTSPLMQPINQHKQLVVIDFEYAAANLPGLEFVNHFTEWCYNYHSEASFVCNTSSYPTEAEQERFVRAYVMHRPQYSGTASGTPKFEGREKTNVPDFLLDARAPSGAGTLDYDTEEKAREQALNKEVERLLHQTRLWRIANSAQWVAWGIVQAKVPHLDERATSSRRRAVIDKIKHTIHPRSDPLDEEVKVKQRESQQDRPQGREQEEAHQEGNEEGEGEGEGDDDHFDYLAYAQERAMFFWGDCVQMGIVKKEDLPQEMQDKIKYVPR